VLRTSLPAEQIFTIVLSTMCAKSNGFWNLKLLRPNIFTMYTPSLTIYSCTSYMRYYLMQTEGYIASTPW